MLTISDELKAHAPAVAVGYVTADVRVTEHDDELWREIDAAAARFAGATMEEVRMRPPVRALRQVYRALGTDPTRYRGSNEALVRRIVQGKELYRVNTVVDVNNLLSLETLHSAGTFDERRLAPPIVFRPGRPDESYDGIGRGAIKIEGLPVFADQSGPFGSTTSDCERTRVQLETDRILLFVISFLGPESLDPAVRRAHQLLVKYAGARQIETGVIQ